MQGHLHHPVLTALDAPVAARACCVQMVAVGLFGKAIGQTLAKPAGHTQTQVAMVGFQAQHIVGSGLDDLPGNRFLAAHGIEGDDAALNVQEFE